MSKENRSEITEKIDNGSYYQDALDWYMDKYIYPVTERSFMIILAAFAFISFAFIAINIKSLIVDKTRIPITKYVESSVDTFSNIRHIRNEGESTQNAVARYLLKDYLKTREEYFPEIMQDKKKIKKIFRKIKITSIKKEFRKYNFLMNRANIFSPLIRYKNDTTRTVKVQSVIFDNDDASTGRATIMFNDLVTVSNIDNIGEKKEADSTSFKARIKFNLPDIVTIAKSGAPLRFVVSSYEVEVLDKNMK